jgi:trans-2,3-dihydro-3-hydroxyanthranilate isomerase
VVPTVPYLLYDVFTDVPFTGNPLAVAIDPPALTTEQCATMAAELGLPETIFVRTVGSEISARIFTPAEELPFAGHPTIGAALALHDEGAVADRLIINEGVGPVEVSIDDGLATLTTARPPTAVEVADPEDVARSLGLTLADLHPAIGPRGWSAGLAFTVVAVRDRDVLGRCQVDLTWWGDTVALTPAPALFVLAPAGALDGRHWRARMFAPRLGIAEDPATGSAAAAAVGVLAGVATEQRLDEGWVITQGVEMGRPSELYVGTVRRGPELVAATVGGRAVRVGRGELEL